MIIGLACCVQSCQKVDVKHEMDCRSSGAGGVSNAPSQDAHIHIQLQHENQNKNSDDNNSDIVDGISAIADGKENHLQNGKI